MTLQICFWKSASGNLEKEVSVSGKKFVKLLNLLNEPFHLLNLFVKSVESVQYRLACLAPGPALVGMHNPHPDAQAFLGHPDVEFEEVAAIIQRKVKALNKIKASLGWRVVYSWVGDDPCGDGDLPPWSGVTCSTLGYYRVVTELEVYAVSIVGPLDYSFMTPTKHDEERGSWREDAKLTTMAVSMVELTKMVQMVAELRCEKTGYLA
ncbi:hypothetical protein Vadar_022842 [Vaccinium darrowii]|uniref:Uncharacterized protein n=1 Tax=Vaccinium darrowii TaxID=229202 RepID=A0ACB7ZL72_9ERIC|nr:hypothetical protein Vadar_022842 [Vaccinium darrowii]